MEKINSELKHWLQLDCIDKKRACQQKKSREIKTCRIFLGKKFPTVYFTQREAECVYNLLLNRKRKEIASRLNLSIRTVEAYITEAKSKIKSHSQKELISEIKKTDFLKNYTQGKVVKRAFPAQPTLVTKDSYLSHISHFLHDQC